MVQVLGHFTRSGCRGLPAGLAGSIGIPSGRGPVNGLSSTTVVRPDTATAKPNQSPAWLFAAVNFADAISVPLQRSRRVDDHPRGAASLCSAPRRSGPSECSISPAMLAWDDSRPSSPPTPECGSASLHERDEARGARQSVAPPTERGSACASSAPHARARSSSPSARGPSVPVTRKLSVPTTL